MPIRLWRCGRSWNPAAEPADWQIASDGESKDLRDYELDGRQASDRRWRGDAGLQLLCEKPALYHAGESATDCAAASERCFLRGSFCKRDGRENVGNRPRSRPRPSAIAWRGAAGFGFATYTYAAGDQSGASRKIVSPRAALAIQAGQRNLARWFR